MTKELKRDFSTIILDVRNKPVPQGVAAQTLQAALDVALAKVPESEHENVQKAIATILGEPLTCGMAISTALTEPSGNEPLPHGEAGKRFALAVRIAGGGIVGITPDERDLMKRCVEQGYRGATVPARVIEMLETEEKATLAAVA